LNPACHSEVYLDIRIQLLFSFDILHGIPSFDILHGITVSIE
jgi:hypothetical protein